VQTSFGNDIKVKLPPERVLSLIDSIADLVVDALEGQFNNMREDAVAALATRDQKLLESQTIDAPQ
jgi:hypothetical protein